MFTKRGRGRKTVFTRVCVWGGGGGTKYLVQTGGRGDESYFTKIGMLVNKREGEGGGGGGTVYNISYTSRNGYIEKENKRSNFRVNVTISRLGIIPPELRSPFYI